MYVLVVTIDIKPGYKDKFVAEMLDDARGSVQNEPGCVRFDVIQDEKEPNRIYLYEVYRDRAAFDYHTTTPHFLKWKDAVQGYLASIRYSDTELGRVLDAFEKSPLSKNAVIVLWSAH